MRITTEFMCMMALSGRGHGQVAKFVNLHPLNYFVTDNGRPFKFYTELKRQEYNKTDIQDRPYVGVVMVT